MMLENNLFIGQAAPTMLEECAARQHYFGDDYPHHPRKAYPAYIPSGLCMKGRVIYPIWILDTAYKILEKRNLLLTGLEMVAYWVVANGLPRNKDELPILTSDHQDGRDFWSAGEACPTWLPLYGPPVTDMNRLSVATWPGQPIRRLDWYTHQRAVESLIYARVRIIRGNAWPDEMADIQMMLRSIRRYREHDKMNELWATALYALSYTPEKYADST